MKRLTRKRMNEIKQGYWSPAIKEHLVQRLAMFENIGMDPEKLWELKRRDTPAKIREIHVDEYYCPVCGSENDCDQGKIEHKFCPLCGQRLETEDE